MKINQLEVVSTEAHNLQKEKAALLVRLSLGSVGISLTK